MRHRRATIRLFLASAGIFAAALGTAADTPLDRKALDLRVDEALRDVIVRGARIYNVGDHAGCYRLFEGALRTARPLLDHRPALQKTVAAGLDRAEQTSKVSDRAFALREVLDRVVAELNPPRPGAPQPPAGFALSAEERTLLDLTNKERAGQGLPPLKANDKLFQAARAHSTNMARQGRLDHTLDGKGPGERLTEAGYASAGWGENVAGGQRTPSEAITSWVNSPGHRANIRNGSFTEVGLGIVRAQDGTAYWTQVLATPQGR